MWEEETLLKGEGRAKIAQTNAERIHNFRTSTPNCHTRRERHVISKAIRAKVEVNLHTAVKGQHLHTAVKVPTKATIAQPNATETVGTRTENPKSNKPSTTNTSIIQPHSET